VTLRAKRDTYHQAVLHFCAQALIVPVANMPELRRRLHVSFAYTEILGAWTYDHYDVAPMARRTKRVTR
jgi:hypothetical protein